MLDTWVRTTSNRGGDSSTADIVHVPLDDGRPVGDRALQQVLDGPAKTTLVPLRVAWLPERDTGQSAPRLRDLLLGDPRRLNTGVAEVVQRQQRDLARCIAGAPATLAELRKRHARVSGDEGPSDDFESFVLRQAAIALDVEERKLRGRRYKVPRAVIEGIETSSRYLTATAGLAETMSRTPADVREEARKCLTELVATPTTFFIDWMGTLTRWITSLGYQQIVTDRESIERVRTIMNDHPSALLWTHKSHVDAIALMSVMYDNDFPAPHSMGGVNMSFAGLGYAGRRAGTVFIRRTFHDQPVYRLALSQYLGYLMEKRFPLSWAFEGTRSRNGKLGPPRYGLLKYAIEAAHATDTEDLHIIPVAINYDLIGETADYAREESGQAKEAESLGWFLDYLRRLRSPMGNIYLDFAEPVVLEGPAPEPTSELLSQVAFEVARRVNAQVPVTLPSLMCMALLSAAPRALTYADLDKSIRTLMSWLQARRIRFARSLEQEDVPELESLAEHVFEGGLIQRVTEGRDTLFAIGEDQYSAASYYRNTIIHYFVNKAIAEVALMRAAEQRPARRAEEFATEVRWLRDLTKFEFFHTPSDAFDDALDAELSSYDGQWREVLGASRGEVVGLLTRLTPLVSHAVLLPYLEAYWLVSKVVAELPPEDTVSESETIASALRLGRIALRQRRIASQASIGKAMFKGALSYLADQGLLDPGQECVAGRRALVVRLDDTIRRVRQIADIAHTELFAEGAEQMAQ